jgi:hypothetical protein
MRRVETGKFHSGEIPLHLFRGRRFKTKEYLDKAVEIVLEGVDRLKVSKDEPIHICTGYVLSKAREILDNKGFNVRRVNIIGPTQRLAEKTFIDSLVRLSIGEYSTIASMRSFDSFLKWVLEDLSTRERYVKTGWSSWSRLKEGGKGR